MWRRLFYEQPQLWESLEIGPPDQPLELGNAAERCSAKLALARRVAPLVRDALVQGCFEAPHQPGSFSLADVFGCLDPAALRSLSVEQEDRADPLALEEAYEAATSAGIQALAGRFPGLQTLTLRLVAAVRCPAAIMALRQLGSLRQLGITAPGISADLMRGCAAAWRQLTCMRLVSMQPLPPLRHLMGLTQLEELVTLEAQNGGSGLQLLPAAAFPRLRSYSACAPSIAVSTPAVHASAPLSTLLRAWAHVAGHEGLLITGSAPSARP